MFLTDFPDLPGARCADNPNDELWFPEKGHNARSASRAVKEECSKCPVQQRCLQYALDTRQEFGFWGGMSVAERFDMLKGTYVKRKDNRKVAYGQATCGTPAGYHKHRRQHETVCPACRLAYNRDALARRNGTREQNEAVA